MSAPPRIGFVGPMLGRNAGWVTTQGEVLADLFRGERWHVRETSTRPSRLGRMADTTWSILRWRGEVDIVVLSVFSGPAFAMADWSSILTRLLRIPTVMVLHGGNLPAFAKSHPRWTRRVIGRAARVVAPSQFLAAGIGDREAVVIPNVIKIDDVAHRRRDHVAPLLLWMRTFHPIYNPVMAVRAFERVQEVQPDARLTMAGQEKGLLTLVQEEVEARGLGLQVEFAGFLDAQGKADAFESHDIYVHTNNVDNMPVSMIEAAAAGMVIVATRVGGIPLMLDHEVSALLVDADDDEAMAKAILRLTRDPGLASRLSQAGRSLAEDSAWPSVQRRWVDLFDQVLAAATGRTAGQEPR